MPGFVDIVVNKSRPLLSCNLSARMRIWTPQKVNLEHISKCVSGIYVLCRELKYGDVMMSLFDRIVREGFSKREHLSRDVNKEPG